jgi:hypothetical protein
MASHANFKYLWLAFWLGLVGAEIAQQEDRGIGMADPIFAFARRS